jgi:hypothetical protein
MPLRTPRQWRPRRPPRPRSADRISELLEQARLIVTAQRVQALGQEAKETIAGFMIHQPE